MFYRESDQTENKGAHREQGPPTHTGDQLKCPTVCKAIVPQQTWDLTLFQDPPRCRFGKGGSI